ncbi:MAG: hypothetical protein ATN35_12155 [Epulopiscium sp. Nele67-Bin004]|nr:MAG: hypothetical protein ATN35_12155 [Epulopiscium sp. Nele67-Bin004]
MRLNFEFDGKKIYYNLSYQKRFNISINVEEDGNINVIAPIGITLYSVMDKVKGNVHWIVDELYRIENVKTSEFKYTYLGKNYGIETSEDDSKEQLSVKLIRGKFLVEGKNLHHDNIIAAMKQWYISKANIKVKERLKLYLHHFTEAPASIGVDTLNSVMYETTNDTLMLDVNCVVGPLVVFDYMLISGLCKFNNMSKEQFDDSLKTLLEERETAEAWLETNRERYTFR